MKPRYASTFLAAAFVMASAVHEARADEYYACRVVMCLSNPEGPTAAETCPAAISQMYRDMARGKPLPVCVLAGPPDGSVPPRVEFTQRWFRDCQPGTVPVYGLVMQRGDNEAQASGAMGVGDEAAPGKRACAGPPVGTTVTSGADGEFGKPVTIYSELLWQSPQSHSKIDVYVGGELYRSVE